MELKNYVGRKAVEPKEALCTHRIKKETQVYQVELESGSRKENRLSGAGMVSGRSEVSFVWCCCYVTSYAWNSLGCGSWEEEVKQREVVSRNIKEYGQFSLISIFNWYITRV